MKAKDIKGLEDAYLYFWPDNVVLVNIDVGWIGYGSIIRQDELFGILGDIKIFKI